MNKNIRNYKSIISRLFSKFIPLIPILEYYNSPFKSLNLATFLAIIFLLIFFIFRKFSIKLPVPIFLFLSFITMNMFASIWMNGINITSMSTYARLVVLLLVVLGIGRDFFDKDVAFNNLKMILYFSVAMIFVQRISYSVFGIAIPPTFSFLARDEGYLNMLKSNSFRPSGLYMEPSHYAMSATIYLTYTLFGDGVLMRKLKNINWVRVFIITAGMILTGSGQGYVYLIIIFILWYMLTFVSSKTSLNKIIYSLLILILSFVSIIFILEVPFVQDALYRVTNTDSFGGEALISRIATKEYFDSLPFKLKWVGVGYGNTKETLYISSFYRFLYECGYFSIIFILLMLYAAFKYDGFYRKIFAVLMIPMTYVSSPFMATYICFAFSFLYAKNNETRSIK